MIPAPADLARAAPALQILELLQAAMACASTAERQFLLLNRTREWLPYEVAVLWDDELGLIAHSGVTDVDRHGPYALWVARLARALGERSAGAYAADMAGLDAAVAAEWAQWWPAQLLVLPAAAAHGQRSRGPTWLILRDVPWRADEQAALQTWWSLWCLAERAGQADQPADTWALVQRLARRLWQRPRAVPAAGWRRWRGAAALALLAGVAAWPVHLTVRAPGELVPREPTVLRAALEGTVRRLLVEPNQAVRAGQVVAELDDATHASRLQVARQALSTAEAEWRQTSQLALGDAKAKAQLAAAQGKYEEKLADVRFLEQQVQRTALVAPHDGVVLIDEAGSWSGRAVVAGEAVMRLAQPQDQELEAWLPVGDAIDLPPGSTMRLHLASRPDAAVDARLRLYAYEAEHRPDGQYAYRLRGTLDGPARERLGTRGTVRVEGESVPLLYWVLRRPLAALREATGW